MTFQILGCARVPLTGRRQLRLVSSSQLLSLSEDAYEQVLDENPPDPDHPASVQVRRVGENVRKAVEMYMADQGMADRLEGYSWEYNVIDQDVLNAWCMPGGKIVVYTGILKLVDNDDDLAVIMGHEIAHAIAEHGNERMSQQQIAGVGQSLLKDTLNSQSPGSGDTAAMVAGLGAHFGVLLPYSRLHESEADHLGLIFMTMAGYKPEAAVGFWQKMAAEAQRSGIQLEFLSTHPTSETRIRQIQEWIPEAKAQAAQYRDTAP